MAWFRRAAIFATGTFVALILVGAAIAGNGNGNGNANGNANGAEHAAEAPGQVKKDATPMQQPAPPAAAAAPTATVAQAPAAPATPSQNDPGVKPSNSTSKNTSCVTGSGSGGATCGGGSKPDSSKQYGNGTTAAEISTSRGGKALTLKGPGNSQPHKVVACGHRHAVDVHAVKRYNANDCATTPSTPDPNPIPNPNPHPNPTPDPKDVPTTPGDPSTPSVMPPPHVRIGGSRIDVPVRELDDPAHHTHERSVKPASSVLSQIAASVPVVHGTLPFTGFPLWIVVATALVLIATGIAMRKRSLSPERAKL